MYWRALQDAADGPLLEANVSAIMDARYAALAANGLSVASPASVKSWIAQRRSYMLSQLATVAAPFAVTSPANHSSTANTLVTLAGTAPWRENHHREWRRVSRDLHHRVELDPDLRAGPGTNALWVQGWDSRGQAVPECRREPHHPVHRRDSPSAGFPSHQRDHVPSAGRQRALCRDLHRSTLATFDVSDWRLDGVDFAFAPGTLLRPLSYLLVVQDRVAFAAAYGTNLPVAASTMASWTRTAKSSR